MRQRTSDLTPTIVFQVALHLVAEAIEAGFMCEGPPKNLSD